MKKGKFYYLLYALRPNQWIKNFTLYATIIFHGELFDGYYFILSTLGFLIFCALSSASYLFNDINDLKFDKLHPIKKKRPLASGVIPLQLAVETAFLLAFFGLLAALLINTGFFLVSLTFVLLHVMYSTFLKKHAILDIMGIAFSFTLRAFAGETVTGYHLPFWLFLTILFVSLFVAATKRHAELLRSGNKTRPSLFQYRERLLDSYTSMFGSASIIAYSLFTFLEEPPRFNAPFRTFLTNWIPYAIDRKWMIITIPFFIYGLMRYGKLAYEKTANAEQPEKIITTDLPLIFAIAIWGIAVILILYIL
jgi:4-hydroxybenzoate polyprenyltransferase